MTDLTAVADVLSEHPEELMSLGVLLGMAVGEPSLIQQAPEIPEGASRGEYAALLRLTQMGVTP
ncbi:hypothetical protein [Streptomyces mirabilis]|uniref:hypothetical protein n=1 Tax=Streptomyces mirabilis TaxID=68239 RepID=UPI0037FD911D